MTDDPSPRPAHSAEQFVAYRDLWWNPDFVELMARRWRLSEVRTALDVGAGQGHWGRVLHPHLARGARITGIDRERAWVEKAREIAASAGLADALVYEESTADALPFPDGAFDLVTCQTVLIHMADPAAVLREMIRVATPGGLVAVAEPNNIVSSVVLGSTLIGTPVEDLLATVRMQWTCERGKELLGEGNNSVGDQLPGMFAAAGLCDVVTYTSDKTWTLFPPYEGADQSALREQILEEASRGFLWDRAETGRFFLAGGGSEAELEAGWERAVRAGERVAEALRAGTYHAGGGGVFYLISGRKPGA